VTRSKSGADAAAAGLSPLFLREEALEQGIEMLYLAERCLTAEVERHRGAGPLSRTAYRALYLIARHPGLPVGRLRESLGISKPNLARVLKQLAELGLVEQVSGARDRRQRLLSATEAGRAAIEPLAQAQRRRLAQAYRTAGPAAVDGFREVLRSVIDPRLRRILANDDAP
jgi:DNA-binding MarR family transcriptional regulator